MVKKYLRDPSGGLESRGYLALLDHVFADVIDKIHCSLAKM